MLENEKLTYAGVVDKGEVDLVDAKLGGDQVHAAGERLKTSGLPTLRREGQRSPGRGCQRSPGAVVPRAADRVQHAVRADAKRVAELGLCAPAQVTVR